MTGIQITMANEFYLSALSIKLKYYRALVIKYKTLIFQQGLTESSEHSLINFDLQNKCYNGIDITQTNE